MSSDAVRLKTPEEIRKMRAAGIVLARVLDELKLATGVGVSTGELDRLAEARIREAGGYPTFLRYKHDPGDPPYPGSICASINEEVVHGIPSLNRKLLDGDVLSVDAGVTLDGWIADAAFTVIVGKGTDADRELLRVTEDSLWTAIREACHPGKKLFDLAFAVENAVVPHGYHLVEKYGGHGVGRALHEGPFIPNEVMPNLHLRLKAGMTLAIEPMVTRGSGRVRVKRDGWTVVTADGRNAAHFEHTVFVSENGPVVLTLPEGADA